MKMKFWQKTYLFTLLLFLVCLNIGILSLTVYTYQKNVEATETAVKAEQYYVAMNFERDMSDLNAANADTASPSLLMQSFGTYYGNKGLLLAFAQDGKTVYSNFPNEYETDRNQLVHTDINGKRHIVISATVCEGKYDFVFAKDVSELDGEFRSLIFTYAATAGLVSLLLAIVLYFILKKLSSPLEKLRKTTETIEAGDYTVMAEERGNDEFTLLAKSFNSMIAKINEQMKTLELDAEKKQMLVDNLAHELRTPLTSIHGYAEYLEKAAASEKRRIVAARYIMTESERLQKISEILLDSAYIRGNPPEMTALDVAPILSDVTQKLQPKAQKAGVELICQAKPLMTDANETLLSMLFFNLAENAVKACPHGGRVCLSCADDTVCVEDNGSGMTQDQLLHITEPFYRTDKSRSRAEGGAGLGLALCRQIVQTHHAVMRFESEIGRGTKVFVTFTTLKSGGDGSDISSRYPMIERRSST